MSKFSYSAFYISSEGIRSEVLITTESGDLHIEVPIFK